MESSEEELDYTDNEEDIKEAEDTEEVYTTIIKKKESAANITAEPNIKCSSCNKKFFFDKKINNIRCNFCGYRILQKLRTKNSIYYDTN
jgi:DNA-directed RNA polymerase subunit RPC12/RpoP